MGKVISVRIDDDQDKILAKFAASEGLSVSDFVRKTIFNKIEDELDISLLEERKQTAREEDYETLSLDEVIHNLNL